MTKIFLMLILYVLDGRGVLEQKTFTSETECQTVGGQRVNQILLDKPNATMLFAQCGWLEVQEVKK